MTNNRNGLHFKSASPKNTFRKLARLAKRYAFRKFPRLESRERTFVTLFAFTKSSPMRGNFGPRSRQHCSCASKDSVGAVMLMQRTQLVSILFFGARETMFETARLTLLVVAAIIPCVAGIRLISYPAYAYTTAEDGLPTGGRYHRLARPPGAVLRFLYRLHHCFIGAAVRPPAEPLPRS